MRRMLVVGQLCFAVAVIGCGSRGANRSSGSLALSNDGIHLYAADTDNEKLYVLDRQTLDTVATVPVGRRPFRVAVGSDDTLYVANRGSRSVSVVRAGEWTVAAELATGVDPVGLQVSADGKTLYVVSATATDETEYGILQAIDTATLAESWRLPVGDEPRGLALVGADRAIVSLYKAGALVQVDLKNAQVLDADIDVYGGLNRSALDSPPSPVVDPQTVHPRAMTDLAATPDGTRVFAPSLLAREAKILVKPTPATPYYEEQGPGLLGSVTTPAVITLDTSSVKVKPLLDDVSALSYSSVSWLPGPELGFPQTSYSSSGNIFSKTGPETPVLQSPSVAVVDGSGKWLFVVNRDTQNVAVISTDHRNAKSQRERESTAAAWNSAGEVPSMYASASIGQGADGIAVLADGESVYVYNQFDHSVQHLVLGSVSLTPESPRRIADDTLTPDEVAGRKLFHDANDRRLSKASAAISCASCHLEGRDDGHTWQFPDGPRQTPTLAGRGMAQTAPYHWSGEFPDLSAFLSHTVATRMGGTGLPAEDESRLNAYVNSLAAPENPLAGPQLTEQQRRGASLFISAQCATCHSGEWMTNNAFADVGTFDTSVRDPDAEAVRLKGLNVPSLRGLARSAPYLHDGKARTLRERLMDNPGDAHGKTSNLSAAQLDDLVAYLKTL